MKQDQPAATDFPAAHSIDTEWYAVDADGYVAVMYTAENGIIPEIAGGPTTRGPHLLDTLLDEAIVDCNLDDVLNTKPGLTLETVTLFNRMLRQEDLGTPAWTMRGPEGLYQTGYSVVEESSEESMLITVDRNGERTGIFGNVPVCCNSHTSEYPPAVDGGRMSPIANKSINRKLAFADQISLEDLSELLKFGVIDCAWQDVTMRPMRFGLFEYDADENIVWGERYLRGSDCSAPIKAEQLPANLKEMIGSANFCYSSFRQGDEIWPRLFYRCRGWRIEI